GAYCTYFPQEIAMAMGAVTVGLCSTSDETIPIAEQDLPKNLCPLVKSSYGFAISEKCPFFYFSDVVVGETTCDGKKKMYELMKDFKKVYIMELPNSQSEYALELWKGEVIRFKEYLEETFGTEITEEGLRHAVHVANEGRIALKKLYELMKLDPAPMMGSKLFDVLYGSQFKFDREKMPGEIDALREKIMKEYEEGEKLPKTKRILLTGCPSSGAPMKVVKAIENNGGNVVVYENCGGAKSVDKLIDENAEDIYQAIAERYLNIGCSVMTPDENRFELLGRLLEEYKVDGVVEMTLQACHTYNIEAKSIEKFVKGKGIPYIHVETDYSQQDVGQLDTRIAAFMEMI
ncbi:MAG: double-cubane-cluster-containing anaerobic reductase, partial [Lachnospiraceae bacterium]|nr:double-cubane-cluster-containing anaerobic reductase [Lachnospiraceae bacterium]